MIAQVESDGERYRKAVEHYEKLDFSGLTFPSDSLSISTLRKVHPNLFDKGFDEGAGNAQPQFFLDVDKSYRQLTAVGDMLWVERLVATNAYAEAAGMEPPHVEDMTDELIENYIRHGIATGPHHAEQLIRDIERQGAELAKKRQR